MNNKQSKIKSQTPNIKRDFRYFVTPFLFIQQSLGTILWVQIIFDLTIKEWMWLLLIEHISLILMLVFIEQQLFLKLFPDCKIYFPKINFEAISKSTFEKKQQLFNSMILFPVRRTWYIFFTNFIKVIPGTIFLVYFCDRHGEEYWYRLVKVFIGEMIYFTQILSFSYACIQNNVSEIIAKLHQFYNFTEVFKTHPRSKFVVNDFITVENVAIVTVFLLYLWLVLTMIISANHYDKDLLFQVVLLGVAAFINIFSIYFYNRKYLLQGLQRIFDELLLVDHSRYRYLPLHSSSPLMNFEQNYNLLIQKIEARDADIEKWMAIELAERRFKDLGEITGLVAHDINGPLQAIDYCSETLLEDPFLNGNKYIKNIKINCDRATELVRSLLGKLKNDFQMEEHCSLLEAYTYTIKNLMAHFPSEKLQSLNFYFDPCLNEQQLAISRVDLIHILYNLFKNSIEHFLNHLEFLTPILGIRSGEKERFSLLIFDNGKGLSKELFTAMTVIDKVEGFKPTKNEISQQRGLGLRLTKRLIEKNGGEIHLLSDQLKSGTIYEIFLTNRQVKNITDLQESTLLSHPQ